MQLFLGWLVDRRGPRRVGAFSAVVAGLGLGLTGTVRELCQVHVLFGGLVAVGAALVELSILTALTLAFDAARGGAVGPTWAGGEAGLFVLLPLPQWLTTQVGWRPLVWLIGLVGSHRSGTEDRDDLAPRVTRQPNPRVPRQAGQPPA